MSVDTTPTKPRLLGHDSHMFAYDNGTIAVNVWCMGDPPAGACLIRQKKVREWELATTNKDSSTIKDGDRLKSLGFRAPYETLQHPAHHQGVGKEGVWCTGDRPNGDCPLLRKLEQAWVDGLKYGVALDPYPQATGDSSHDLPLLQAWHERNPGAGGPMKWRSFEETIDALQAETGRAVFPGKYGSSQSASTTMQQIVNEVEDAAPDESPRDERAEDELISWWTHTARKDILSSIVKVREYGGCDLLLLGRAMYGLCQNPNWSDEPTDGFLQELGVYFYLQGKIGRCISALQAGSLPSEDTLLDIVYYGMMLRRIRQTGNWP